MIYGNLNFVLCMHFIFYVVIFYDSVFVLCFISFNCFSFYFRVYIMGGALRVPGNISPLSEFNFGNDAAAAALVVVAFSNKITILPLDATMDCLLSAEDLLRLAEKSGSVGKWFANDLAPYYMKAYRTLNSIDMPVHDAHTVAALIRPDLYEGA